MRKILLILFVSFYSCVSQKPCAAYTKQQAIKKANMDQTIKRNNEKMYALGAFATILVIREKLTNGYDK